MDQQATADEIIAYLDRVTSGMLERPEMYAASPEALEVLFHFFEEIRALATTGKPCSRYPGFCARAGFGAFNYSTRQAATRGEALPHASREEHTPLIGFLKAYLVHENRWPLNVKMPEGSPFPTEPRSS